MTVAEIKESAGEPIAYQVLVLYCHVMLLTMYLQPSTRREHASLNFLRIERKYDRISDEHCVRSECQATGCQLVRLSEN